MGEDDDENQRDYSNAFAADFYGQEADIASLDEKQPAVRVADPMEQFENFQTAEDKLAVASDIPEAKATRHVEARVQAAQRDCCGNETLGHS